MGHYGQQAYIWCAEATYMELQSRGDVVHWKSLFFLFLFFADEVADAIIQGLQERNHKVNKTTQGLSSITVVMKESDHLYSYADNRTVGAGNSQF